MRNEDLTRLKKPYKQSTKEAFDSRFNSAIGANIPSAEKLTIEIFNDFDPNNFGINWWLSLPTEERILISDYLYQCASTIDTNLVEAKLHFLEWLDAKNTNNEKIANSISLDVRGEPSFKIPKPKSPYDELHRKLEEMHICGFFRAIGSTLDCLGSLIIGVIALPVGLRRGDIGKSEKKLNNLIDAGDQGSKIQLEFRDFFKDVKTSCGSKDWLEWADQYRNMYVHRGRRTIFQAVKTREVRIFNASGQLIPRAELELHLAKYPDRSEVEAFIKNKDINLNEEAETTIKGIFDSCRTLTETICEKLLDIWILRRSNPNLLEQPIKQWTDTIRECDFVGYDRKATPLKFDSALINPILGRRMLSSSVMDHQRHLWDNTKWK